MLKKYICIIFFTFLISLPFNPLIVHTETLPIFQGSEGCGALACSNLNTTTYNVTNLNDSGTGSLRDAVSMPNRTIVFNVSGTIALKSELIFASNLIIDGNTAPNEGITISGQSASFNKVQNDVIRYVRFHQGLNGNSKKCALYIDNANNIMVDHISIEFGRWDNLHLENSSNVTVQYSIIADGITPQHFGSIMQQCDNISIHHCLWANNKSRNPKAKSNLQFENNVVYNWGVCGFVGGHSSDNHYQDLINNYFIAGPDSSKNFLGECTATDHIYSSNNYVDDNKDGLLNGRLINNNDILNAHASIENAAHVNPLVNITLQSPDQAYNTVLTQTGDSLHRDNVDINIINQVKSLGFNGKILYTPASS